MTSSLGSGGPPKGTELGLPSRVRPVYGEEGGLMFKKPSA